MQNVYNMGYDLANFLAVLSIIVADGDLVTKKLSIGCDATTRTSFNPALSGSEPGLDVGLALYRFQRYEQSRLENPEL